MAMTTIEIVILAAGQATRFGSPKQLTNVCGQPMLQLIIASSLSIQSQPFLVLGAYADEILADTRIQSDACRTVLASDWQQGMSASLKASIRAVQAASANCSGVLVLLGDQPKVDTEVLACMLAQARRHPVRAICSRYPGALGVPAYIPAGYFKDLLLLDGDQGARALLQGIDPYVMEFEGKLADVDRPEDLAGLKL